MLARILLSIYFSMSFRTARIAPNPTDYEYKIGSETTIGRVDLKHEREDGGMYWGFNLRTLPTELHKENITSLVFDGIYGEIQIDESRDLNQQLFHKDVLDLGHQDIFKIRYTKRWDSWQEDSNMLGVSINLNTAKLIWEATYDTDFEDKYMIRSKLRKDILLNRFTLSPFFVYDIINGDRFWQAKVEIKYQFGDKK